MNEHPEKPETPLEADPIWDLVDKAPTQPASAHFARKTVQLVREQASRKPWWHKLIAPAPITGFAAAAAAIALLITLNFPGEPSSAGVAKFNSEQAEVIQEIAETEMLIAAADNPSEFSDQELVCLLGF